MIEGLGYILMYKIVENVWLEEELCEEVLFYMLGLLVIDIVLVYDYIILVIGVVIIV